MVNINGRIWDVLLVPPYHPSLRGINDAFALGVCDNAASAIYINNQLTYNKTKKVLYHELAHAILYSYNIQLPHNQKELFADLIATFGQEIIYKADSLI